MVVKTRLIAVITVDDGWLDGLTVATPLLERLGLRATFTVCPGWFGARAAGYELAFTWSGGRFSPMAAPRLPAPVRAGGARLVTKLAGVRVPNRLYTMVRPPA